MSETSQESQKKPVGNTKTTGPQNQLYRWFLTIPYEKYSASQLSQHLKGFCKEFYYQAEEGESGYRHWQICISLNTKEYFGTVKNHFCLEAHIEPCKDWFQSKNYCNKNETRIEGPYSHKSSFVWTIKELNEWQKRCLDIVTDFAEDEYHRRTIHWVWSKEGCLGKTEFCRYMMAHHGAILCWNACSKDVAHIVSKKEDKKIILFDFERGAVDRGNINYNIIERLKGGILFSGKYDGDSQLFNHPNIMCFANEPPEKERLSKDRWNVIEL